MIFEPGRRIYGSLLRPLAAAVAVATLLCVAVVGDVSADPASDALARMNELSRQAEQTTEAMHTAQIDLDAKLAVKADAEEKNAIDLAAVEVVNAELAKYQTAVDKVAAASYMGGSSDALSGVLTASSPQDLIDQLSIQKTMSTQMAADMAEFTSASQRAAKAAQRTADSAAQARLAADQATEVRAELQAKQGDLRAQSAAVQAQFEVLTPDQRAVLADPGPPPPAVPGAPNPDDPAIVAMPDPPVADVAPTPPSGEGAAVVQAALTRVGSPYSWGATGPNAFDCSGLIKWAFLQNGKSLPRSSQALAEGGQPVAVTDLQAGDIVTFYSDVSHAGIYIGDGMMVHASTFGTPVKVAPIASAPIHNARRY